MDALHAIRAADREHPGFPQAVHACQAVASLWVAGLAPHAPALVGPGRLVCLPDSDVLMHGWHGS